MIRTETFFRTGNSSVRRVPPCPVILTYANQIFLNLILIMTLINGLRKDEDVDY